jgi:hypothetical protein
MLQPLAQHALNPCVRIAFYNLTKIMVTAYADLAVAVCLPFMVR